MSSYWENLQVKSMGNVLCPVCRKNGRLKADLRNASTRYYVTHHQAPTRRLPYYGKYLKTCYVGISQSFDLDFIMRAGQSY
jgi:hypothetical protein